MLKYIVVFAGASLLAISLPAKAQEQRDIVALSSEEIMTPSDTVPRKKTVIVDGVELNEKQLKRYYRQLRKDSIRAARKLLQKHTAGKPFPATLLRTDQFQLRQIFFPVPQKGQKHFGRLLDLPDSPQRTGMFHQERHYFFHSKDWISSTISCFRYRVTGASESAFGIQS